MILCESDRELLERTDTYDYYKAHIIKIFSKSQQNLELHPLLKKKKKRYDLKLSLTTVEVCYTVTHTKPQM